MYPNLSQLDEWKMRCLCGARAEHAYGRCRKCSARAAWRRRKGRKRLLSRLPKIARRTYEHVQEVNV